MVIEMSINGSTRTPGGSAFDLQSSLSDVLRLRANQMILGMLLDDVSAPAGGAAACEQRHERLRLESQGLQNQRGVELDVGAEVPPRLALVEHAKRDLLDAAGEIEEPAILELSARHLL